MIKALAITSFLLFSFFHQMAQSAGVELKAGYGFYEMQDFKEMLNHYKDHSGLPYVYTDNYDPDINFGGAFVVGIGKFETGVDYHYYTSLGELSYHANSTTEGVKFDVISHALGLFGKYPLFYSKKFQLKAGLLVSLYSSKAGLTEYSYSSSDRQETTVEVISKSVVFTPSIEPVYYITGGVYLGLRGGYAYDLTGYLHAKKDNDEKLLDAEGSEVRTDWTGIRTEFFVGLRLNP